MPKITRTIQLNKPVESVWIFLNDAKKVGTCLPGCQEVKIIDDYRSFWKVKVTAGIVSRVLDTIVTKSIEQDRKRIVFDIRTTSGDIEGKLGVSLSGSEGASEEQNSQSKTTSLSVDLDIKASGSFSWVINQMVGKQSDKMIEQFVACVERNL